MPYEIKKVFASLPQVERGVSKIIGGDPKGNNFLYTNGKCVVIRNIDNPAIADIYTEHAHQVVVAKYAPSGFYIASGGKVSVCMCMRCVDRAVKVTGKTVVTLHVCMEYAVNGMCFGGTMSSEGGRISVLAPLTAFSGSKLSDILVLLKRIASIKREPGNEP